MSKTVVTRTTPDEIIADAAASIERWSEWAHQFAAEVVELRDLLQLWEPRVNCPQCGERYRHRACGPTHAVIHALVYPGEGDNYTQNEIEL